MKKEKKLTCSDCLHCNYNWCKEAEDDFYKISADNDACEDYSPKECEWCVNCIRSNGKYYCKYNFRKNCKLFTHAELKASKDIHIWPPRKARIV